MNNAGIQHTAPVRDFPAEQWEAIIAINLFAAFYPTQGALPYMLERNWSRVRRRARRALCSQDRSVISARTLPTEQQPGTAMPVITGMSFSRRHLPCSGCALVRASCTRPLPIRRIEGRGSSGFVVAAVSELEPLDGRAGLGTRRLLTYASRSRSFLLAWT